MRKIFALLFFLFTAYFSYSQNTRIGVPFVRNYKPEMYHAAEQNWCTVEDSCGLTYFANESGVLCFNGKSWEIVGIAPNLSSFKSLAIDKNGTIYAGCYADFGYLTKDEKGKIYYQSIADKIPNPYRKFDYIWAIVNTDEGLYFQSTYLSFLLKENNKIIPLIHSSPVKTFSINNTAYVLFYDGLKKIKNNTFVEIPGGKEFTKYNIMFILPYENNDFLVGTESDGLFIFKNEKLIPFITPANQYFKQYKLYCGTYTYDENIVIGTLHAGVYIIDKKGKIVLHLHTDNGIQNNNIISIKSDNIGNLWVLMDKGIDYVELNSAFSKIQTRKMDAFVYSVIVFKNKLYVATHHGLFWYDWNKLTNNEDINEFTLYPNISEINWCLKDIEGTLFLGHDKGAYILENNNSQMISDVKGGWIFRKLSNIPNTIIGGTYTCLTVYKKIGNSWKFIKKLNGINESCRLMEEDKEGNLWITSGYYGVYKVTLSENADSIVSIKFYDSKGGFPNSLFYGIFKIDNEILFGTQYGTYQYNKSQDKMEPHPKYYQLLGNNHIRMIAEGPRNTIWYITGSNTGIYRQMPDGKLNHITIPLQKIANEYVPGFENINFVDDQNVIIGTRHGLLIYNFLDSRNYFKQYNSIIESISVPRFNDSLIIANVIPSENIVKEKPKELPYKFNNLHFKFSALYYENPNDLKYKYFLEGFDDDWSQWTDRNEKEYTNLPEGSYIFRLKAKNIYDYESKECYYKFIILPPFYRSRLAYLIYVILIVSTIWYLIQQRNKKFEKEKQKIEQENQKNLRLQNAEYEKQKLEEELKSKQKELAVAAMNVAEKNEKLIEIKEHLLTLDNLPDKEKRKIRELITMLDNEINNESYWEQFEMHFNSLNDNFLNKLKQEYPSITHKDLKMCAFIRMNLSNKEIASLLNITLRGVEASRLRLRKKFNLPKDMPLTEFIIHY